MAEIQLRNLCKCWGSFVGVDNFDLTIADREFLVLLGPSGCGKTTTMRMIAGLEDATEGDILVEGRRVNDLEPKDRNVAMVFQSYALYPNMNVYENIRFPLKVRGIDPKTHDEKVRRASAMVELDEFLHRKPAELSGGQRQRVALARAIVREPNVFLMDEPLSNLDAKLRVQMRAEIARLQRDLGVTTVYVTHDQVEAMTMGDRVAVLKDGYLQQVDSPQNLYDRPDNVFVAAFIGSPSMNLHEAALSGTSLTLGSHTIELHADVFEKRPGLKAHDGKNIIIGFRPEDLEDSSLAPDEKKGATFPATVTLTEALGSEIIVHFELDAPKVDAGDPDAVDDLTENTAVGRFDPRSRVMLGDTIEIAVNTINLHFFDAESRSAIW